MTYHDITNKMSAIVVHLRRADTLITQPTAIEDIRKAMFIALDVGEECGKTLTKGKTNGKVTSID